MKVDNTKLISINKDLIKLSELLTDTENLDKYKEFMSPITYNKNITDIYSIITFLNLENFKIYNYTNLEQLKKTLIEYIDYLILKERSMIKDISFLKKTRNILLMITFILLFIMITTESVSYYLLSNEITYCLKRIELKDYDFNIKQRNLPYSEDILDKIDNLRLNLKNY